MSELFSIGLLLLGHVLLDSRDFFLGPGVETVHNCNGAFSAWAPLANAGPAAIAAAASFTATRSGEDASSSADPPFLLPNYEARGAAAMARWAACAYVKACVCPEGSTRGNHRQDQAALTMTLATLGLR
jgi:hypothetical protein